MSLHSSSIARIGALARRVHRTPRPSVTRRLRRFLLRLPGRSIPVLGLALLASGSAAAGIRTGDRPLPITGRWDVTVTGEGRTWPAWFEITESPAGLSMRMVGSFGAPLVVPFVTWDGRELGFRTARGERWRGVVNGRVMRGTVGDGRTSWAAVRAPRLETPPSVRWGAPARLFDGRTLAGWQPRHAGAPHGWTVRNGALANVEPREDLRTVRSYRNFKLSLRFRLQPGADSGVHLRGRYEVQLTDRLDPVGFAGGTGAIYGMVAPGSVVACPAGQWHTLEVTLLGREVTVMLDGVTVIDRDAIAGITGDALDSREGAPGPIVLQGYLGEVEFRDIVLTPAL